MLSRYFSSRFTKGAKFAGAVNVVNYSRMLGISLSIKRSTQESGRTHVGPVGKHLFRAPPSHSIIGFIVERDHLSVQSVAGPSMIAQPSLSTWELILGLSPTDVSNVVKPSARVPTLPGIRELTLGSGHMCAPSVGGLSLRAHTLLDIRKHTGWGSKRSSPNCSPSAFQTTALPALRCTLQTLQESPMPEGLLRTPPSRWNNQGVRNCFI